MIYNVVMYVRAEIEMTKENITIYQESDNSAECNSVEKIGLHSQAVRIGLQKGEFEWGYAICNSHTKSRYIYIINHMN